MAKIIRPNLVNTVRSSEISAMLRWGALFAVLLAGAVGLLLAKQYLPAAVCILILPIALPLAKKQDWRDPGRERMARLRPSACSGNCRRTGR